MKANVDAGTLRAGTVRSSLFFFEAALMPSTFCDVGISRLRSPTVVRERECSARLTASGNAGFLRRTGTSPTRIRASVTGKPFLRRRRTEYTVTNFENARDRVRRVSPISSRMIFYSFAVPPSASYVSGLKQAIVA